MPEAPFPRTLTHARLRRAQGDTRGAIAILEALIDAGDESEELVDLYLALGGDTHRPYTEPEASSRPATRRLDAAALRAAFSGKQPQRDGHRSIRRLEDWLARLRRADG